MKKIVIGSKNRTKVHAVKSIFTGNEIQAIQAPSFVLKQPIGNDMTRTGAINRAQYALEATESDYSIGLEGGVVFISDELYLCNWGALLTSDNKLFTASGSYIPLPNSFKQPILVGEELGYILECYTNKRNIRLYEGAIGLLTNGLMIREEMYAHIVTLLKGQLIYNLQHE